MTEPEPKLYRDFATHSDRFFCPTCAANGDFSDPQPPRDIYPVDHPYTRAWKARHYAHLYGMSAERFREVYMPRQKSYRSILIFIACFCVFATVIFFLALRHFR